MAYIYSTASPTCSTGPLGPMKNILRYECEGLPAINSQAPLWYASLHENQDMAPEYAKRLTTEDEVAIGWTSRVYWITMLYGYVSQTRRTQGTIVSSVSFFTIGRLRVLHPYHTHHLGPLLGGQSSERRWLYQVYRSSTTCLVPPAL